MKKDDAAEMLAKLAALTKAKRAELRAAILARTQLFSLQTWAEITGNLAGKVLKRRTGRLATSIKTKVVDKGNVLEVMFGSNVPYAAIHELGGTTKPHVIRPKRKEALKFSFGGKTVFAKVVNHPGSKIPARPYMAPAIENQSGPFKDDLFRIMEKIVASVGE